MSRRILSIDGGGIKGVLPAAFLATLEDSTAKRVVDYFDLIAGTSTGGIIALGLALGMPASEILSFYEREGPTIFPKEPSGRRLLRRVRQILRPKYDAGPLRYALERAFGDQSIADCKTRVLIPAFARDSREIHIFKTAHHERLRLDWKERVVDVAMATAAAPTYFPSHRSASGVSLVDGGVWANNPVGLAVVEAITLLAWEPASLRVLSVGCSDCPFEVPEHAGAADARALMEVFAAGQSQGSLGTAKLLLGGDENLYRYQAMTPRGTFGLDRSDRISELAGIGVGLARRALPVLGCTFFSEPRGTFAPLFSETVVSG